METDFETAKAHRDVLEARVRDAEDLLSRYPRDTMNLTPDNVKFSAEYRRTKVYFDEAFYALRIYNAKFVKRFAKELRAERLANKVKL